jgi:hypothetical protein
MEFEIRKISNEFELPMTLAKQYIFLFSSKNNHSSMYQVMAASLY